MVITLKMSKDSSTFSVYKGRLSDNRERMLYKQFERLRNSQRHREYSIGSKLSSIEAAWKVSNFLCKMGHKEMADLI